MEQLPRTSPPRSRNGRRQNRNIPYMESLTPSDNSTLLHNFVPPYHSDLSDDFPNHADPLQIDEEEVVKIACDYEAYSNLELAPEVTVRKGLRNLDDVTPYGISAEVQKDLWRAEIKRLISTVTEPGPPISFEGTDQLNHKSKEAYEVLMHHADQMLIALNITMLDTHGILSSHSPKLLDKELFKRSREGLEQFTEEDDDEEDVANGEDENTKGSKSRKYGPEGSRADYFELVNYITAVIAKFFCKAARGRRWHKDMLAHLATLSTKLKAVSHRPKQSAIVSLEINPSRPPTQMPRAPNHVRGGEGDADEDEEGNGGREGKGGREGNAAHLRGLSEMFDAINLANRTDDVYSGPRTKQKAIQEFFWYEKMGIKHYLHKILRYILAGLRGTNRLTATSKTSYEMCALVYDTYFQELPTLVYTDVDGDYLGTSKPESLSVAHAAFEVLNLTMAHIEAIHEKKTQPSQASSDEGNVVAGTSISWYYSAANETDQTKGPTPVSDPLAKNNPPRKKIDLRSMSEIIMVRLPLTLASPLIVEITADLIEVCAHNGSRARAISLTHSTKFNAFFSLSTDEHRHNWTKRKHLPVTQLSRAFLAGDAQPLRKSGEIARTRQPTTYLPTTEPGPWKEKPKTSKEQEIICKHQQKLTFATKGMKEWVLEENGVRVHCKRYVWIVLTIAAALVLGGIAAGMTIRDRLTGVDPFNITTFCWIVAGFVILVAKSVRVAYWPWRDFLRCQVLCRSVSELRSVTRIDDQLILARLLHDESISRLRTRGPYNCVFSRKTESDDGFSIDRPLSIRTMLLSGLIMIQVQSAHQGEFLACLDLRKGTEYKFIDSTGGLREEEYIISEKLTAKDLQISGVNHIPLTSGKSKEWNKVIGIYGQGECYFT